MTDNIVTMPTPMNALAKSIHSDLDQVDRITSDWIERTLSLASKLLEGKKRCDSDNEFHKWLFDNDLLDRINRDDRAALINMAGNPELSREETNSRSWRLIWRDEMHERFRSAAKPDVTSTEESETVEKPIETPTEVESAESEVEENYQERSGDIKWTADRNLGATAGGPCPAIGDHSLKETARLQDVASLSGAPNADNMSFKSRRSRKSRAYLSTDNTFC